MKRRSLEINKKYNKYEIHTYKGSTKGGDGEEQEGEGA